MRSFAALGICVLALAYGAKADITNGGFETGNLSGWTMTATDPANNGWFADNIGATPQNFLPTVGPSSGSWYAVTDQYDPGSNALSQSFTVPLGTTFTVLKFDYFINDYAGDGDFKAMVLGPGGNVLTGTGAVFTDDLGTQMISNGVPNPYATVTLALSLTAGQTYTLDFLETDIDGPNNVGLDKVSVVATPEPGSVALLLGIVAIVGTRFRRRLV
jgi:hypothetical protein